MQFETALNLAWLVLGLIALATTARVALSRAGRTTHSAAWLHIIGVALIVASLFPYISVTDDALRAEHYAAQHEQGPGGKHTRIDNLMRLYEAMDNPIIGQARAVVVVFFFISVVFAPTLTAVSRIAPFQAGRSPPFRSAV